MPKKPSSNGTAVPLVKQDYVDERGRKARVLVPDDGSTPPSEGIPISLDLSVVYGDAPDSFIVRLTDECWARGLIEPSDFLVAGAAERIRSALFGALRYDPLSIQTFAKDQKS